MNFSEEFNLLLKARYSLIHVATYEEDRLEYTIRNCINLGKTRAIYTWNFIDGFENGAGKRNPLQALEFIEKMTSNAPALFILKDFNKFFTDLTILRKVRNLARVLKTQPKTIIVSASDTIIPEEIRELITILEFKLPDLNEIRQELFRLLNLLEQELETDKETFILSEELSDNALSQLKQGIKDIQSKEDPVTTIGTFSKSSGSSSYDFENVEELKTTVRSMLHDDMAEEANICFQFAMQLFEELESE